MMKKSIFAVAVASALTLGAAQAETILYGSIRYDYNNHKTKVTDAEGFSASSKRLSDLKDAGSRIGIKGSEDLGNNNAVIYNLEWGFNGMDQGTKENPYADSSTGFKNRIAYLGLTGDWGTFTAGRQHNPFKVTIVDDSIVDDFNGTGVITSAAQRAMTTALTGAKSVEIDAYGDIWADYEIDNAGLSRVGKVIAYTTPDFAGFSANVALMMDANLYRAGINNEKNVDLWTINAKYDYDFGADGTLTAKAGYIQGKLADNNKSKVWGLFLGYNQDAFGVTFDYANGNHKSLFDTAGDQVLVGGENGPKEKSQGWDIGARYSFGDNYFSTVRATYGQSQIKVDGSKDKVKSWAIGFEQKLSTRTRAWVEYGNQKTTFDKAGNEKFNAISVGMRHDF